MIEDTTGQCAGRSSPRLLRQQQRARPARVWGQEEDGRWGEENNDLGGEGLNLNKIEKTSTGNWILISTKVHNECGIFSDKY